MTQSSFPVQDEDVIWLDSVDSLIVGMRVMCRKDEFEELALSTIIGIDSDQWNRDHYSIVPRASWVKDGVSCDALLLSQGKWMHGKVKIRIALEFYPDEELQASTSVQTFDNSPLDDIRQSIQ